MVSFSMLPAEQDVYVTWKPGGPSLQELRLLRECVPELAGSTVAEMYQATKGTSEFHVGRFDVLRAMAIHWACEERGLSARLA
jgi:hypothetical protein